MTTSQILLRCLQPCSHGRRSRTFGPEYRSSSLRSSLNVEHSTRTERRYVNMQEDSESLKRRIQLREFFLEFLQYRDLIVQTQSVLIQSVPFVYKSHTQRSTTKVSFFDPTSFVIIHYLTCYHFDPRKYTRQSFHSSPTSHKCHKHNPLFWYPMIHQNLDCH